MERMKIAIVGMGAVGRAMLPMLIAKHTVLSYDPPARYPDTKEMVNDSDIAIVCVPTPSDPSGACDTSIVEDVCEWITCPLIIVRSTVPPGTTRRLRGGAGVVFMPEFAGPDDPLHDLHDPAKLPWVILGGLQQDTHRAAQFWKGVLPPRTAIMQTDWQTAEFVKYLTNAYLATKVAFVNEMAGIAGAMHIDWDTARELWLLDPRVGRSHTAVFEDQPGFDGKCLPKDMDALIAAAADLTAWVPILRAVQAANRARLDGTAPIPNATATVLSRP